VKNQFVKDIHSRIFHNLIYWILNQISSS